MDIHEKLKLLGQAARFDDCVSPPGPLSADRPLEEIGLFARPADPCPAGPDMLPYVSHVQAPGGRRVPVLKVLQTSV